MQRHIPDCEDNPDPGQADTPQKFSCLENKKRRSYGDVQEKKCLTHSPRLDNSGITDQGHQNSLFAVSYTITKRPFVNECNRSLCGAAHQKPLGFHTLSAIREISQTTERACYIRYAGAL